MYFYPNKFLSQTLNKLNDMKKLIALIALLTGSFFIPRSGKNFL